MKEVVLMLITCMLVACDNGQNDGSHPTGIGPASESNSTERLQNNTTNPNTPGNAADTTTVVPQQQVMQVDTGMQHHGSDSNKTNRQP